MRGVLVLAALLCVAGSAAAQDAGAPAAKRVNAARATPRSPLPVAMPQELSPPQEAYAAFPEAVAVAAPPPPSACQLRLAKIAAFHPLPTLVGAGECGAVDAVLLDTVILSDQTKIAVTPPATLRCPMAEEVAHWVREDVAPTLAKIGPPLRAVDDFDSYECRGRNRVRGATLSEHGRANALDVRGFRIADGRTVGLTDVNVDKDWRESIRASVCARFSTVLGPGSDGAHEEHIHLDLAERRNNYKLCEWDVRVPIVVQAKDAKPQSEDEAPAEEDAAQEEATAAIPAELVPLPRARPVAAR